MKPKSKVFVHFTENTVNNKTNHTCNFCKTVYNFKNSTKFACHLLKCKLSPKDVKDEFQKYNKKDLSTTSIEISRVQEQHGALLCASSSRAATTVTSTTTPAVMDKDKQMDIHQAFARAIYVTGTPLSLFEHPLWEEAFHKVDPLYTPPSRKLLAIPLLNKEYAAVQDDVTNKIKRSSVLHLAMDGWSNLRKEPIINVVLYAPKPYFYKFIETKDNKHTAEYLCEQVTNIIKDFEASKFLAVITDNAANMVKFGKLLHEKYNQTMWAGCLAHTLHLFVKDVLKLQKIRCRFSSIVNIIKVINRSHILGAQFRRIAEEKSINVSLQLPVKTRWGSYLMSLQSFLKSKLILQNMVINDSNTSMRAYKNKILRENTWIELQELETFLKPIVEWIFLLEGDYFAVHLVHKAFDELEKLMNNRKTIELLEDNLNILKNKFDERKANALKPLHFAAAILDPKNQGINLTSQQNVDGCEIIHNLYTNGAESNNILVDISNYKTHKGIWEKDFLWKMAETSEPVTWWETLFPNTALGQIATKILSVPATSAAVERSFSTFANIHTKKRNRLKTERAGKITFISHNWKLINKSAQKLSIPDNIASVSHEPDIFSSETSDSEDNFSDITDTDELDDLNRVYASSSNSFELDRNADESHNNESEMSETEILRYEYDSDTSDD